MHTKLFFGGLALLAFFTACSIDGGPFEGPEIPQAGHIRFDQPAAGQTSRYVLLKGENFYEVENQKFEAISDTLILTVVAVDADGLLIEEKLSLGSVSRKGAGHTSDPDSTFRYRWMLRNDSIIQKPFTATPWVKSHFSHHQFALPLRPVTGSEADLTDWKVRPYCQEGICMSFDTKHLQYGRAYTNLNLYSNNIPMTYDGPGIFFAYSREAGFVRSSWYGAWRISGYAWNLLP